MVNAELGTTWREKKNSGLKGNEEKAEMVLSFPQ